MVLSSNLQYNCNQSFTAEWYVLSHMQYNHTNYIWSFADLCNMFLIDYVNSVCKSVPFVSPIVVEWLKILHYCVFPDVTFDHVAA